MGKDYTHPLFFLMCFHKVPVRTGKKSIYFQGQIIRVEAFFPRM